MWCEELPNGKVKYIERYKDPLTLKTKRVSVTMDKDTVSNRKKALSELNRKIDYACCLNSASDITLEILYDAYISHQEATLKASTFNRNKRTLKKVINLIGPEIIVNNLTAQYVNKIFINTHFPPCTLNEYIKRLKAMIRWGYNNDYTDNFQLISKLKSYKDVSHASKIKDKYLEPDELNILLNHMYNTNNLTWYYLSYFLSLSGLRIGEALALLDSDIDDYIHVNKNYDYINDVVTSTKTETSERDVYVQPELASLIKKIRAYQKEYHFNHGIKSPLFLCNSKGGYISYAAYNKYLREVSERVLGHKITVHVLRHTHASLLMAQGVGIETISRRLGHENSNITKEIYLHVTKQLIDADNAQLKNIKIL